MTPLALVVTAPGTNRDLDVTEALGAAGAAVERVRTRELTPQRLADTQIVVFAGGFSHADALGSGAVWANDLRHLRDELQSFATTGGLVIGICNGFQALVRLGLLPGSLGPNASGSFTCRWVTLEPTSNTNVWTDGLDGPIDCPVAHGEGRYVADDTTRRNHMALRYAHATNPNGSDDDIAGVTDTTGRVLGLMPHPENHIRPSQHPRHHRGGAGGLGLALFRNGVRHTRTL